MELTVGMECSGLDRNPGMGLTVPRESKQALQEPFLPNTMWVWDSEGHLASGGDAPARRQQSAQI